MIQGTRLFTVGILSAAVLGFEVSLMRLCLVASWHHFAFLVISIALLGFGASGTVLSLVRRWLLPRYDAGLFALTLATSMAMPLSTHLVQKLPVQARFAPILLQEQIGYWMAYWALLAVPFLLGASAIGLALMAAHSRVSRVYAVNLAGSGIGALLALWAMHWIEPRWLPTLWGAVTILAVLPISRGKVRPYLTLITLLAGAAWTISEPPRIRIDPYKYRAHVERLESEGKMARVARAFGPRGVIEIYRGDVIHHVPFLTGGRAPPPLDLLLIDGHRIGPVLRARSDEEAEVVDHTLMSFPYELLTEGPRALLLGELTGLDIWLARRQGATVVHAVQPDPLVYDLLRRDDGDGVLDHPTVSTAASDPRHHVEHSSEEYDLIQLVTLESSAVGSGGLAGLGQDHLVTVEGLTACLERLDLSGILSVCRGIQTPPRDNLKLVATLVRALRGWGIDRPEEHIVIVRDFLAVCTMTRRSPWTEEDVVDLRKAITARDLTPVWFPGVRPEELNQPDEFSGPEGEPGDWYYHGARMLFSEESRQFIDDWIFDIRPPTDDRPFFLDFCRLRSIGRMQEAFGDLWLARAEIAFIFVIVALLVIAAAGALIIVLPLAFLRELRGSEGKTFTAGYFICLGFGYLLVEMVVLSRMIRLLGEPVYATAVTLSAFLIFSGAGSFLSPRIVSNSERFRRVMAALVVLIAIYLVWLGEFATAAGAYSMWIRAIIATVAIAPLAFLMGTPMPSALVRLDRGAAPLLPWAWGVNGLASVCAAPLATLLAMTWGFRAAGVLALILYAAAARLFPRLPDDENMGDSRVHGEKNDP